MKLLKIFLGLILSAVLVSNVEAGWPYSMTYEPSTSDTIQATHLVTSNNEHINNNIPESIDDLSVSVAEMRSTSDPYAGDTEVQATTLAIELQQVRDRLEHFVKAFNPSLSYWYEDVGRIRSVSLKIEPGATPGTNIDITEYGSIYGYNVPTITDGTDIAKSGSSGSFSLDFQGQILTMDITENVIGILSAEISVHALNSASTTEVYFPVVWYGSNNLNISLVKRGATFPPAVDMTTILDAGDQCNILISFMTDS